MKKYLKRLLSMMMAVLLCFGIVPSNAFAAEYEYDGYISMIDYTIFSGCCDSFILFLVVVLSLPKVTDVTVT